MRTKSETWQALEPLVRESGCEIFDLDVPPGRGGVMRVFITRAGRTGREAAVGIEECARVSKRIIDMPEVEEVLPGEMSLEVSSPGINRKLSRVEHFKGAIGERVKITVARESEEMKALPDPVVGQLVSCDEQTVAVEEPKLKKIFTIPFGAIRQARVDFLFGDARKSES